MIGEHHDQPSYVVLQILVVEKLKQKGISLSVGIEASRNSLHSDFLNWLSKNNYESDLTVDDIEAMDPNGTHALKTVINKPRRPWVPNSRHTFYSYLKDSTEDESLTFVFNDAAIDYNTAEILHNDPATLERIKKFNRNTGRNQVFGIHAAQDRAGLTVRNYAMADNSRNHAKKQMTDGNLHIHVMSMGAGHLYGSEEDFFSEENPFDESIVGIFNEDGEHFLSIDLNPQADRLRMSSGMLEKDKYMSLEESINGLSFLPAQYMAGDDDTSIENNDKKEIAYIKSLLEHTSLGDTLNHHMDNKHRDQKQCGEDVAQFFDEVRTQQRPSMPAAA